MLKQSQNIRKLERKDFHHVTGIIDGHVLAGRSTEAKARKITWPQNSISRKWSQVHSEPIAPTLTNSTDRQTKRTLRVKAKSGCNLPYHNNALANSLQKQRGNFSNPKVTYYRRCGLRATDSSSRTATRPRVSIFNIRAQGGGRLSPAYLKILSGIDFTRGILSQPSASHGRC